MSCLVLFCLALPYVYACALISLTCICLDLSTSTVVTRVKGNERGQWMENCVEFVVFFGKWKCQILKLKAIPTVCCVVLCCVLLCFVWCKIMTIRLWYWDVRFVKLVRITANFTLILKLIYNVKNWKKI